MAGDEDHTKLPPDPTSNPLAPLLLGRYETELLLAGQVPVVLALGRSVRLIGFMPTMETPGCHGCDCGLALAREQLLMVLPVGGIEGPSHARAWLLEQIEEHVDSVG